MRCTFTSTIVAIMHEMGIRENPAVKEIAAAKSLHVLTFSSKAELFMAESEGRFSMDEWDVVEEKAKTICLGDPDAMDKDDDEEKSLQDGMKAAIEEKVRRDERWREGRQLNQEHGNNYASPYTAVKPWH